MEQQLAGNLWLSLEEVLEKGVQPFPRYAAAYPQARPAGRVALLLAALSLGEELEDRLRELLTQRESAEKQAALLGLGEMGNPLAEGYLARIVRERPSERATVAAVRGLGRIRGARSLPLVVQALDNTATFAAACEALAAFGGTEATEALLARADHPRALAALADLGAPQARERFLACLAEAGEAAPAAARGPGALADPSLGTTLLPHLESVEPELRRAAFEAYARLGAPDGTKPLLEAAKTRFEDWMISPLGRLDDGAVHEFLLATLEPVRPRGLLRWLRPARPPTVERERAVCGALRAASASSVVDALAARLGRTEDPLTLREILANQGLRSDPRQRSALRSVWGRTVLLARHLALQALRENPDAEFLAEALALLGREGFLPFEGEPAGTDRDRMLQVYGGDNNPCILVDGFLDSGLVALDAAEEQLRSAFAQRDFPSSAHPRQRFSAPEETHAGDFLGCLTDANPAKADVLSRLWGALAKLEAHGDPAVELFLSWTGVERGGIQRAIGRGFPSALARYVHGLDDRHLRELDDVAAALPPGWPTAHSIPKALENARRSLMAECRDIALMVAGSPRGDMVLVEEL